MTGVDCAATITAGGASRRFGSDKALHVLQGLTLLERVAGSLGEFEPKVLIAPPGRYELPGWHVVPDARPGLGPLAGLEVALAEVAGWTAFAAVDFPHLTPGFWAHLTTQRAGVQAVCPLDASGRRQPLAALYHASLQPRATALLDRGERRVQALLDEVETRYVPWEQLSRWGERLLLNANTRADLA